MAWDFVSTSAVNILQSEYQTISVSSSSCDTTFRATSRTFHVVSRALSPWSVEHTHARRYVTRLVSLFNYFYSPISPIGSNSGEKAYLSILCMSDVTYGVHDVYSC